MKIRGDIQEIRRPSFFMAHPLLDYAKIIIIKSSVALACSFRVLKNASFVLFEPCFRDNITSSDGQEKTLDLKRVMFLKSLIIKGIKSRPSFTLMSRCKSVCIHFSFLHSICFTRSEEKA